MNSGNELRAKLNRHLEKMPERKISYRHYCFKELAKALFKWLTSGASLHQCRVTKYRTYIERYERDYDTWGMKLLAIIDDIEQDPSAHKALRTDVLRLKDRYPHLLPTLRKHRLFESDQD